MSPSVQVRTAHSLPQGFLCAKRWRRPPNPPRGSALAEGIRVRAMTQRSSAPCLSPSSRGFSGKARLDEARGRARRGELRGEVIPLTREKRGSNLARRVDCRSLRGISRGCFGRGRARGGHIGTALPRSPRISLRRGHAEPRAKPRSRASTPRNRTGAPGAGEREILARRSLLGSLTRCFFVKYRLKFTFRTYSSLR